MAAVFPLGLSGCRASESRIPEETRAGRPDQESWQVEITLTDRGRKRAVVTADHLEKYNERDYILLDHNVVVDFFDEQEQHTSNLRADRAEIEEGSNFMRALGSVVVVSDSGVTLYTDTLSWDNEQELIYTEDSVMLTTEMQDTLYGVGFESDVRLEYWKILQPSGVTERGFTE
jgi:LPS export ABC transporter protein LptC